MDVTRRSDTVHPSQSSHIQQPGDDPRKRLVQALKIGERLNKTTEKRIFTRLRTTPPYELNLKGIKGLRSKILIVQR